MDADVPFIGQIVPTAATFVPYDWLACNGQTLSIGQYQALYSLIGNNFGGSYNTGNFGLPNLMGRITCGSGASAPLGVTLQPGQTFGQTAVQLTTGNLPAHGHGVSLTLDVGANYVTSNGTTNVPPSGGLLANAVAGTTTVDVYAPAGTAATTVLPVGVTGTPTITAGAAGGTATTPIIQPTVAMYMCIATNGEYPINQ